MTWKKQRFKVKIFQEWNGRGEQVTFEGRKEEQMNHLRLNGKRGLKTKKGKKRFSWHRRGKSNRATSNVNKGVHGCKVWERRKRNTCVSGNKGG